MSKDKLKYILFLVAIIVVMFAVSVGIILLVKSSDITTNNVNASDVEYIADSNTIIIKNIISVSEDFGKNIDEENGGAFGYLKFKVKNNTDEERNYQVYITKQTPSIAEINSNYITFYLTDSNNKPFDEYLGNKLPSFDDFHYIEDLAESKIIHNGTLKANEEQDLILRVWIADNFVINEEEEVFSFEIDARAY